MGSQEFIVLYTHQKTKKSKVWQDGILKVTHLGNKAILYDDKGDCLESIFLKHLEVKPGDDLESDRYLITVEEVKGAGSIALKHDVVKEAPELKSRRFVSSGRSLGCQPAGLKRKFPGFLGPYQVPKKMVATENGQPAASLEAKKPGPTFLSPLYSMSPLFSTASQKDTKNIPTDSNNTVTYKNRERNDLLSSSVVSTPSFKIYPEVLCRENYFCSADSSVSKDADSLVANKPMKRDRLTSHCSGISQNIRSKAQILALLKSKSTSTGKELNSENTDHFPQIHPQESIKIPAKPKCLFEQEKCTEVKSIETLHYQHQSESAMRNKSQWAMYLSSQSSLIHSSDIDESGTERKHKVQEDDINANMKDLLIQKKFFETDCEMGEKYNEDKQVDDNHPSSWDQEVNFEITSSNKSASLPGNYSNAENNGLLSVPHVQGNNKISLNHNDQVCVKGPIITRENSLEVNTCGTPEIECKQPVSSLTDWEHIQIESSLSNDFGISDDSSGMFSKSNANHEGINSINEPMSDVPQPFLEITFNLNNFETSDTEEEPQEGSKISQDSECLVKEMLVNNNSCVQKRCENKSYKEIGSENLPLSMSVGGKPIEPLPTRDTLPTQLSARTRVDFDTGTFKAENTGKERKEFSDTLSNFDSEWTGDMCVDSNEDANKSIQKIKTDCDVVSLSNKFKGIETNLHIHQFLGVATDQTPENNTLFTEDTQPQPFILGSNLDKTDDQVFSSPSSNDNSIQLLNTNQSHSEYIALDESTTQVSNTSFYPLREKSSFSKEPEAHSPGSKDLGTIGSLSHEHTEIESAENCKRDWNNSGNSSGLSGLVNNISLLRSLSEHSTALESLEVFQKKNTSKQQGFQQTSAPESSPEGSKPLTTVVSQAIPKLHLLNQDSPPQKLEEDEIEPNEPLESFQVKIQKYKFPDKEIFPKGGTSFNIEDNFQMIAESDKDTFSPTIIVGFPPSNSEHSYHYLDYNFKSAKRTLWEANKVTSSEQKISTLIPVSTFSLPSRDEDFMPEFSNESLRARTLHGMKKPSSLEKKNFQRLPLQQKFSSQDLISRNTALSLNLEQTFKTEEIQTMLGESAYYSCSITSNVQEINASELSFPSGQKIKSVYLPQRQIHIPAVFQSPAHYKQIFTSCLIEHLNILLFTLSQKLYKALSNIDISFYTSSKGEKQKNVENNVPSCHHHQPAKLVMVKKEGPNKGRLFYTCDGPKADRCKFFKWLEEVSPGLTQAEYRPSMVLSDIKSIGLYLRSQKIPLYEECQLLVRKGCDFQGKQYGKLKKFTTVNPEFYNEPKSKLYLKLSRKESSSSYSKNDLWVVSKTLDFELDTFIACSAFFGPSSVNEVELLPLKGYFPSKWPTNIVVHALLVCNASTELTTLKNIQNYFNPGTLPLMQHLLTMSSPSTVSNKRVNKKKFIPPAFTNTNTKFEISPGTTLQLASELIQVHKLNKDQATALIQIAEMMASHESVGMEEMQPHTLPITIIHAYISVDPLLTSSGSVPVKKLYFLLFSYLHAGSENENEQLKELHALMKEDLTPVERLYVRKSIEQHKLGTNRTLLKQVRVVGVTCAACPFPCLNDLKFPVVVLDESSQITEPASLLPIARFECEKLILVGDPKQLPPTIQGSDAAHENGLEQTLFDRLCLMGHKPVILRTQYRCHPAISAIANDLFYEGNLMNGVSETERSPLLEWLPTLCFYNVKGLEQIERDNSFHNVAEAAFTLKLIQSLIASGIAGYMIGVITLYKSQMYKLCHLLSTVDFDHSNIRAVQVSTVDAFQGAEKEIIILSCVRTRQVGFIDSEKRMNVALTRGKRHLLIVGNIACLRKNRLWGRVIQHCEGREDGLQHASQYEPWLNHLLKDYLEKRAEEKQQKKSEKEKSPSKLLSQTDIV
ncbi:protein ZGRF1 [Orycteropus afer afer]|uniref:Protein ZGRF1 n=1 Tax=Orycteropus afer afer TaxID=1230840 RepID=A0AC54Z2A6_ORYAF|nr:protein ZGRF1 [Orycteropus afer afer]